MVVLQRIRRECGYFTKLVAPSPLFRGLPLWLPGIVQAAIDVVAFLAVRWAGVPLAASHILSFCVAVAVIELTVGRVANLGAGKAYGHSLIAALMVIFVRGGLLALMMQVWALTATFAILPLAVVSSLMFLAARRLALGMASVSREREWYIFAGGMILYALALRLVYIPSPNLIPEEAYYWNYAQHLDWGYLDHPPMVAWIIKLGTMVFGNTEFGVRIGAVICWLVTVGFGYRFARELLGRRTAFGVALLLSWLPFFFGTGCLLTPDTPLTACWAGALFYLQRALLRRNAAAWLGAGICIGLGMLSKYTIGLLVPAAVLYVLIDRTSRKWLARPQPYLACLIATALFSPVIYWNAKHEWVSFVFQTARRINEASQFSLHVLLGEVMLLLTPTALAGAIAILMMRGRFAATLAGTAFDRSKRLFVLIFTLVPLTVVTFFSLTHEPKLNWTGPSWLAVLPLMAWTMSPSKRGRVGGFLSTVQMLWRPTALAVVLFFGATFHYLALGFPGVPYPSHTSDIAGWRDLQRQIAIIEDSTRTRTGTQPLICGMDRYNISSELAFYGAPDGPRKTAGRHLFGESGLMYKYWFPESAQIGKPVIIVARDRNTLEASQVTSHFDSLSLIGEAPISLNGERIGEYYYRVGYGYAATLPTGP